jgi:enamine deaminase RidA (YjgF/YER057c/UK114 family)
MNEMEEKLGLAATPGYRYASHVRNQLFISGQVPHNKAGEIEDPSSPFKQAKKCLSNLDLLLNCYQFNKTILNK